MSNWQSLLESLEKDAPLGKQLSVKAKLRDFQDIPTAFVAGAVNQNLRERGNSQFDSEFNGLYQEGEARAEMNKYLKGPFKSAGLSIIASGAYGIACKLPIGNGDFIKSAWEHMKIRVGIKLHAAVTAPEAIVAKFVRIHDGRGLAECLRETRLQAFVSEARVPGRTGIFPGVDGSSVVPSLFFGGLLQIEGKWWFMTFMAMAPGEPVKKYLQKNPLTAKVFANVEKAIYSMWLIGVAHGDFHPGNVLYDAKSGRATVIDLGFAVKLPDSIVQVVRNTASVLSDPADVYEQHIAKYVSTIISKRGEYSWFNPDGRVLQFLYNGVKDKNNVTAARLHCWTNLSIKNAKRQILNQIHKNQIPAFYPDDMNID